MVNIGVIGLGGIGVQYLEYIKQSNTTELAAVSTRNEEVLKKYSERYNIPGYTDYKDIFNDDKVEAVLVAVPHYLHTPIAIEAFENGLHVLTEKPVGVHVNDIKKMMTAYEGAKVKFPHLKFGTIFQKRTHAHWKKIKEMIDGNELGDLVRVTWIITSSFRTQAYFNSSDWRATWKGEGGGVLINQSSHELDLYSWFFGLPERITGFAEFGKYHNIEVEDDVTIVMHHSNGMTGHFITNTAESPGTNRLEIIGENGKLIYEEEKLLFYKNKTSMFDLIKNSKEIFKKPEFTKLDISINENNSISPYTAIVRNFGDAVLKGSDLIAPAVEGLNSVEISNGTLLSQFTGTSVQVPIDGDLFENKLHELIY